MQATIPRLRSGALDYHERTADAARGYASVGVVPTGKRAGHGIIATLSIEVRAGNSW
jgi:hypothetical protein